MSSPESPLDRVRKAYAEAVARSEETARRRTEAVRKTEAFDPWPMGSWVARMHGLTRSVGSFGPFMFATYQVLILGDEPAAEPDHVRRSVIPRGHQKDPETIVLYRNGTLVAGVYRGKRRLATGTGEEHDLSLIELPPDVDLVADDLEPGSRG